MSGPNDKPKSVPPQPVQPVPPAAEPTPQAEPTTTAGASQATAQATAAVSTAVTQVRARLQAGEQLVLVAAAVIVAVVYILFEFLLDYRIVGSFTVVLAVLTILAIWIHRWGHHDFGNGYRIVVGALGLSLALFAIISLLAWVRVGGNSVDFMHLVGRLIYWVSGIVAGYGAWLVFRTRVG